jgi:lysylphosphatidylglycerol synthetase-like protein (DUF2156 family)
MPTRPKRVATAADATDVRRIRHLVAVSEGDPLAPFALRPEKQYVFAPAGDAAVGYQIRLGTAVASGDPVGAPTAWPGAIEAFTLSAQSRGLRIAVLGAGERARPLWEQYRLSGVPIGRDVVVRGNDFTLTGRRFRNLRQAIQRSHNAGVKVEIIREGDLTPEQVSDLRSLIRLSRREDSRGFSMILGRLFDGGAPDAVIAIARDRDGQLAAVHRYLWAGQHDLSLDMPIRAGTAPNGVDERIIAEMVDWGREQGVERVSLAFAPFPDLFVKRNRLGMLTKIAYGAVHLLDPLIRVERLYRYLRKFHAFDQQRFVMLRRRQILIVAVALLLLEFGG